MKWPFYRLGQLCNITIGATPRRNVSAYWGGDNVWVTVSELNGQTITDSREHITDEGVKNSASKLTPRGTLLFSFKLSIGKMAFAGTELYTNEAIAALPIFSNIPLETKFLYYALQQIDAKAGSHGAVKGKLLNKKKLEQLKIPLPTLSEQHRIVESLDQANWLRKLRTNADTKAQRILPALFIKMFGDPATNPMRWGTVPLDKVVEIGTQLVDPNQPDFLDLPHIGGEQIEKETGRILSPLLVRNSNLRSNKFYFSSDHILYSKIRPYLNKVAYPRFNGVCSADIYPLRPKNKNVTHWHLISLLRTQAFLDYAKMYSDRLRIPKLNKIQLGAFEFPLPDPHILIEFDEKVKKIVSIENGRFARQEKVENLYKVILHRAFSGDLTASWREAHMKELLQEMELQAKTLAS